MRKITDRVLGLIAPTLVAEASECDCDGGYSFESYCFCGHTGWAWRVYTQWISCNGCRLSYSSCRASTVSCNG